MSVQAQMRPDRNALSRPAFSRMTHDERCQLYFPVHGDQVWPLTRSVHPAFMTDKSHCASILTSRLPSSCMAHNTAMPAVPSPG